jgi:hypothetical protein
MTRNFADDVTQQKSSEWPTLVNRHARANVRNRVDGPRRIRKNESPSAFQNPGARGIAGMLARAAPAVRVA